MKEWGFPRRLRMRRPGEFQRVYQRQMRAGDRHLLLFAERNMLGATRLGLSVSRKHGNAVRRARLKRLLREAFRLSHSRLPAGLDLIAIPRPHSGATLDDYQESLRRLSHKLSRRLARPAQSDQTDGETGAAR